MHPIIAMWSHPRSVSTAIERIMRERGDCTCFHEPFMYDYYINRAVRVMPGFEPEPDKPQSYEAVKDCLLEASESGPVFFKDMGYYVVPRIFEDRDFADRLTSTFLIRDPVKSIPSYYKLDAELTLEEIGLEGQWRLFDWTNRVIGKAAFVLDADLVQNDTQAAMRAYWEALGLPFVSHAFEWQSETVPDDWKQVEAWHQKAQASTSIRPAEDNEKVREKFELAAAKEPKLHSYLAHHRPFYEKLRAFAVDA